MVDWSFVVIFSNGMENAQHGNNPTFYSDFEDMLLEHYQGPSSNVRDHSLSLGMYWYNKCLSVDHCLHFGFVSVVQHCVLTLCIHFVLLLFVIY